MFAINIRRRLKVGIPTDPSTHGNAGSIGVDIGLLGDAIHKQDRFSEAEPLLLEGYNGLKQLENTISEQHVDTRLTKALQRLVDLYTAWNKPDEASKWQAELDKRKAERMRP